MSLGLIITSGHDNGRQFPICNGTTVIGREKGCGIRLESGRVSRQHAQIEQAGDGFWIRDLGSSNGIVVNGEKTDVHCLADGDQVKIGGVNLRFEELDESEEFFSEDLPPMAEMPTLAGGDGNLRTICIDKEALLTQWAPAGGTITQVEASRTQHDLEAVYHSGREINSILNTGELIDSLVDIVFFALPNADGCSIHLVDEGTGKLECQGARNVRQSAMPADQMFSQTIMQQAIREHEAVLVQDVANDDRIDDGHSLVKMQILSALCVPIQTHAQVFGVIHTHVASRDKSLSEEDLKLLAAIGLQSGAALHNARLFEKLEEEKAALVKANQEIKRAQEKLVQTSTLAAVGQLAEGIFHDIKTPFQVIRGFAEMAALEGEKEFGDTFPGSQLEDCLGKIRHGVDDSASIITSLMEFARPEEPQPFRFSVNLLIDDTLKFLKAQLYKGQVRVNMDVAENLPRVFGDPNLLKRVFVNLVMNAVQSMDKGGNLKIACELGDRHGWNFVVTHIIDEGHGMDYEQVRHAFDPFYSTRREKDTPNGGLGLGLAVCYGIVQSHGGEIDIKSSLGEGTTISLWLPLADDGTEPTIRPEPKETEASCA